MRCSATPRIPVVYLPHANTEAVTEHAVALLLGLAKRLAFFDAATREGRFGTRLKVPTVELCGKRIGIVGMGSIGHRVARICYALEMEVIAFDPSVSPERRPAWARWVSSLDELLQESDVISLHVPLTPETRHLLGARELGLMRPHVLLVNTAHGAVVDEEALITALQDGQIGGAALDVYRTEPVAPDSPLLRPANVLLTPRVAGHSEDTLRRMAVLIAEEVLTVLGDGRPRWLANPELVQGAG